MKIRKESGQSLVELAISITMLLFLLAGSVEFGIAFFQFVQLRDAVQEGALYGSMNPTDRAGIEQRLRGASNSPIDLQNPAVEVEITILYENGFIKPCEGNGLEVKASFPHKIFMPFLPKLIGRDVINMNAVVVDTILFPVCQ